VPTKVGTYQEQEQSSMARLYTGQKRAEQKQAMRRTVPWRAEQGSAPTKNAACKGGIFVPALPEQQ